MIRRYILTHTHIKTRIQAAPIPLLILLCPQGSATTSPQRVKMETFNLIRSDFPPLLQCMKLIHWLTILEAEAREF